MWIAASVAALMLGVVALVNALMADGNAKRLQKDLDLKREYDEKRLELLNRQIENEKRLSKRLDEIIKKGRRQLRRWRKRYEFEEEVPEAGDAENGDMDLEGSTNQGSRESDP